MATILSVYTPTGQQIGKCDARCYNGKPGRCSCVCGGINHAVGLQQAASNTLNLTCTFWPGTSRPVTAAEGATYKHPNLNQIARQSLLPFEADDRAAAEVHEQVHGA